MDGNDDVLEKAKMIRTIQGHYHGGLVELSEKPAGVEEADVLVTFLADTQQHVNLYERGFTEEKATDLRIRLKTFAEDWNRSEMDAYDAM